MLNRKCRPCKVTSLPPKWSPPRCHRTVCDTSEHEGLQVQNIVTQFQSKAIVDRRLRPRCVTHEEYLVFIVEQTLVGIVGCNATRTRVIARRWWAVEDRSQKVPKHYFGHFQSSQLHADGTDWLERCDFLLVFYGDWPYGRSRWNRCRVITIHMTHCTAIDPLMHKVAKMVT